MPSGITTTGYPAVAAQCRKMGVVHDDWQAALGKAFLAKRENGMYAAGIGGIYLSTCRQVGKTFTVGTMIFALCALNDRTKVLWTSHHGKTTDETFEALTALARRSKVAPFIKQVLSGSGKQQIKFTNGSRIIFGAREHGFGRGIPGVKIVVFDEAQILKIGALKDMVPAANTIKTAPGPLIIYMGTPPDPQDTSEVFKGARRDALAVERVRAAGTDIESDELWVEIGADEGADPNDRTQWAKGNPSYPDRTPAESILRLKKQLRDDAAFVREGMGVWDSDQEGSREISETEWKDTAVDEVSPDGIRSLGVAFSPDGARVWVAGALKAEESTHLELIDTQTGNLDEGIAALADWIAQRWRSLATIRLSGRAGSETLALALSERKVPAKLVRIASTPEYLASCAMLPTAVRDREITHPRAPEGDALDASIAVTDKKLRTGGGWGWTATTIDGDETPTEAISLALWGARTTKRRPGRKTRGMVMT